ncbi:MAG: hypothetical protein PWR13_309 [Archaeoglobi archaeon]|nr:hypothetical protein [Archaeoglobi archaeon]MDK2781281.1 hypothetical protein [Archaeoglobi archaeon]
MNRELKSKDFAIFLVFIPALLTSIYMLPSNFKELMVLHPSNPSLLSLFFSNFVHNDLKHFAGNLCWYCFLMFLILMQVIDRRKFYIEMALIFLVLPWVNSIVVILHLKSFFAGVLGFSSIVSALFGYLFYSTCYYVRKEYGIKFDNFLNFIIFIFGVFTFNLAVGMLIYAIYTVCAIFFLISVASLYAFLYFERNNLREILDKISHLLRSKRKTKILEGFTVWLSLFSSFAAALVIFPATIVMDGNIVNIVSHLIGYGFGIVFPMVIEAVLERGRAGVE